MAAGHGPTVMRRSFTILLVWIGATTTTTAQQVVEAFPNLSFHEPVFLTFVPDQTGRIAVVQQDGVILVFANDSSITSSDTLLNISQALSSSSDEEGLLGLAFDPGFAANGHFYIDYTAPNPLRTVIRRFTARTGSPIAADTSSGFIILEIDQPFTNHNGGMLAFGPDSDLYIGMGDGGSGGDPQNNAQDRTKLLGKILRVDVRDTTSTSHYRIPPDNPFAGNLNGYREEIWAYGLRNPWRFSFDPVTGQLWAGDVGQGSWEEVDHIERGKNYGWRIMEGSHCYNPSTGCDTTGLTLPIIDYSHAYGIAITGGYVYRGSRRPDLAGAYIYGDYGSGRIWELTFANGTLLADSLLLQLPISISSFGTDDKGELYIVSYSGSTTDKIYRFATQPATSVSDENIAGTPSEFLLAPNYPNPFNPTTVIRFQLPAASNVNLVVYDLLGREVAVLVNESKAPGSYEVSFNAARLASGVYLCRITSGNFTQTRSMILVR